MSELGLIQNKQFLGMDFLTWLLAAGEARGGEFLLARNGHVSVVFDNKILLSQDGEQVDYRGEITNLEGVRLALRQGMKVAEGRLMIKKDDREWRFSINGRLLQVKSLRLPKAGHMNAEELWYERVEFIEELLDMLDELYSRFLELRLAGGWEDELITIRSWLEWI
ncbi:hypothetical protein JW905_17115 [bacterium]|nr:hypothetical protein [candidate division CSSED10-310 bacterium]